MPKAWSNRDLRGTSGDPNAGDPIQYDELRIEHDQGDVEIAVSNRPSEHREEPRQEICWNWAGLPVRGRRASAAGQGQGQGRGRGLSGTRVPCSTLALPASVAVMK